MKFIVHNLRMIWARLSNSGWVWPNSFGIHRDVVSLRFSGMYEIYFLSSVGI